MDYRKTFFILPNLFTLACVFAGFTSLCLSATSGSETSFYLSALAILIGFAFDGLDGRVARLTKTQSDLGRDLDSLSDIVTFGAAPALLVYKWGLTSFGRIGILIAGIYVAAGALRLARFNVLARREAATGTGRPGKFFLGLPIPTAASLIVFMVVVSHNAGEYRVAGERGTAAIVLVLSALMVSRVRFRSFKDLHLSRRTVGVVLVIALASLAIVKAGLEKAFIFLFLVLAYIVLGLTEEIIFFRSRRAADRAARAELEVQARDEEVLRELGAFDGDEAANDAPAAASAAPPSTATTATRGRA